MRLTGTLLQIEHNNGTFPDRDNPGREVEWSNATLHVLEGIEVVRVKVKGSDLEALPPFKAGDSVDLRVKVSAQVGARGPYLTVGYDGVFLPSIDAGKKPLSAVSGGN